MDRGTRERVRILTQRQANLAIGGRPEALSDLLCVVYEATRSRFMTYAKAHSKKYVSS